MQTGCRPNPVDVAQSLNHAWPAMTGARAFVVASFVLLAAPAAVATDVAEPDWSDVGPIFEEQCVMCHSSVYGAGLGLVLDNYEGAIAGSLRGPVLIPGDAEGSELVRRLLGVSVPRMPFLGVPMPQDQIELITRWIDAGLPEDLSQPL